MIEKIPSVALYDPGANITVITSKFLRELGKKQIPFNSSSTFNTISGTGRIEGIVNLNIQISNISKGTRCFVVNKEKTNYDIILGLDTIKLFQLRQDENLKIWLQNSIVSDANCKENKNEMNVHTYAGTPVSELQLKLGHLKKIK